MLNAIDTIIIDGLSFSLPLFIMAIGGIYSERSGVTNLALEGLQGMGAFIGALAATLAAAGGKGDFIQNIKIESPKALTPYEVARQTRNQTRNMVLQLQGGNA